jgi:hypothetical protein
LRSSLEHLKGYPHLQLQSLITLFVHQKTLEYALGEGVLEILDKILEVDLVPEIVATRVEAIGVDAMGKRQGA